MECSVTIVKWYWWMRMWVLVTYIQQTYNLYYNILLIILFFLIGYMIKVTLKNYLMHKFYCMPNKHCWVRLSNFKIIHSTGIIRVTRHKYEILFAATTCVEFIFPEETTEIFLFVKYNELNMRLIHSNFSFSWNFILLLCLFNFIMLRTNCSSTWY